MGFSRLACVLALLFAAATLGWSAARAQAPAAVSGSSARRASVEALARQARGADGAAARSAVEALAASPGAAADHALAELIHEGASDALTDGVLEALAAHPRPGSLQLLIELAQHRRAGARTRALTALAALRPERRATQAFVEALSDSDPNVRGSAARALGDRSDDGGPALQALLRAIVRGVPEAGRATGQVAPERALPSVHEALAGRPMQVLLDTYDALLARPSISEAGKLDLIARLGEIASPSAKAFLQRLIADARFPKNSRLERAAADTEKRIEAQKPVAPKGAP